MDNWQWTMKQSIVKCEKELTEISSADGVSLSFFLGIQNAPWKLNIVIIDAIYEKATVKENF